VGDKNTDDLEFNDGFGDMLREKRTAEKKDGSLLFLGATIVVGVACFAGVLTWGTRYLTRSIQESVPVQTSRHDSETVDRENRQLIKEMEKLLAQASGNVTVDGGQSVTVSSNNGVKRSDKLRVSPVSVSGAHSAVVPPKKTENSAQAPLAAVPSKAVVRPIGKRAANLTHASQKGVAQRADRQARQSQLTATRVPKPPVGRPLFRVIAGLYGTQAEASTAASALRMSGYPVYYIQRDARVGIQVGAFKSESVAESVATALRRNGYSAAVIKP